MKHRTFRGRNGKGPAGTKRYERRTEMIPTPEGAYAIAVYQTEKQRRKDHPNVAMLEAHKEFAAHLQRQLELGKGGRPRTKPLKIKQQGVPDLSSDLPRFEGLENAQLRDAGRAVCE